MMRRSLARLAFVASISLPLLHTAPPAIAQEPGAPADAASNVPAELQAAVENYWHYGKIARYDLQKIEADKITASGQPPVVVLEAFEKTATGRGDNLDDWVLRWQGIKDAADTANAVAKTLAEGRLTRRGDQRYIESQIQRLGNGERAYLLGVGQLRESGELAVPLMVAYLQNPQQAALHGPIRRALRDLGRSAVSPLVAATEIQKDTDTLLAIVDVLGAIGYDAATPYLKRLAEATDRPASVRQAATAALARLGASQGTSAADAFYELSEKIYYGKTAIVADPQAPAAYVWFWSDDKGLTKQDVPPAIFAPVMAMRTSEYSLKLGQSRGDALSIWLAANYKREAALPQGATDTTRPEGFPSAHYFGVSAGAGHLYSTLDRALRDNDAGVALRAIKSLREIVGAASLPQDTAAPLIAAMRFSDKLVRYEAAFVLASAMPAQEFSGAERVVPLLAEAVSQTGTGAVVVLAPRGGEGTELNKTIQTIKGAGISVVGGATAQEAVNAASQLPSVDAILVSERVSPADVQQLLALTAGNGRLDRTPRIFIVESGASPYVERAATDPLTSTARGSDAETIKAALEAARTKAGTLPLTAEIATEYALKAATLLENLAGRQTAYNLASAEPVLETVLNDARPEIVKAAGNVLATIESQRVQPALLAVATNEKSSDDVKIATFKSLAGNAKRFGDKLSAEEHATLEAAVEAGTNLDVRAAAAEARGALNLPADQAKTLILKSSRT
jgi:hypothetical protein